MAWPVLAGTITRPTRPDPLLDSGPTVGCAAGADYAPGIDVSGNPVVPADAVAQPVPVPDSIVIPMGGSRAQPARPGPRSPSGRRGAPPPDNASIRDSTYIGLDGRRLEPLLNPPPCGAVY